MARKINLPPGAVVFTGNQKVDAVNIHHLSYDKKTISDKLLSNHTEINFINNPTKVDWYDIRGLHDEELIKAIGGNFDINSMVLADIADPYQRATMEEYPSGIFVLLKSISFNPESSKLNIEHVGLYFAKNIIITFQEDHSDLFEMVRKRIHLDKGQVRSKKADYLAFALIDNLLDQQFLTLDLIQEEIEKIEDLIIESLDTNCKQKIHFLKKEIIKMRRLVSPLREAMSRLSRIDNEFIDPKNEIYFRDLHDMVIQINERLENQRDYLNGLQDLLISEISFKMNEIMKVLTIITTIFVPLSFLAGLYGMNFENIPELKFKYGYFYLLSIMGISIFSFILYFKKKKWL